MADAELPTGTPALEDEEHSLERDHDGPPDERTLGRPSDLEVALDPCWDLLLHRRPAGRAGEVCAVGTVEACKQ